MPPKTRIYDAAKLEAGDHTRYRFDRKRLKTMVHHMIVTGVYQNVPKSGTETIIVVTQYSKDSEGPVVRSIWTTKNEEWLKKNVNQKQVDELVEEWELLTGDGNTEPDSSKAGAKNETGGASKKTSGTKHLWTQSHRCWYRYDHPKKECNPPDVVVQRAEDKRKELAEDKRKKKLKKDDEYNLLKHNCEHFAYWCKLNYKHYSKQVAILKLGLSRYNRKTKVKG